jgi:hypothetical protein
MKQLILLTNMVNAALIYRLEKVKSKKKTAEGDNIKVAANSRTEASSRLSRRDRVNEPRSSE